MGLLASDYELMKLFEPSNIAEHVEHMHNEVKRPSEVKSNLSKLSLFKIKSESVPKPIIFNS